MQERIIAREGRFFHMREIPFRGWTPINVATKEQFAAYQRFDFPDRDLSGTDHSSITHLTNYGLQRKLKIEIRKGRTSLYNGITPLQCGYLMGILQMILDSVILALPLRIISIGSKQPLMDNSSYEDGEIFLAAVDLAGPRVLLLGILLHEIGHAVCDALLEREENRIQGAWGGLNQDQLYAFTFAYSRKERQERMKGRLAEYIAETFMIYCVDSDGLRRHIKRLKAKPGTRLQGKAQEVLYRELKDRVFGGRDLSPP